MNKVMYLLFGWITRKPTAEEFNDGLLEEAKREFAAQTAAAEYSTSMAEFYKARINRLEKLNG